MKDKTLNSWKVDILVGKYPNKLELFNNQDMKIEILSLFEKIGNVYFVRLTRSEVIRILTNSLYDVDIICDHLLNMYKSKKQKIDLIYEKNNKLKFDIVSDDSKITIKMPISDIF